MNKLLLCSSVLALFANQATANAFYFTGKFGGSQGDADSIQIEQRFNAATNSPQAFTGLDDNNFTDNVFVWGGALGYKYDNWLVPLRMETEYLYRNHYEYNTQPLGPFSQYVIDGFKSHLNTQTMLANFYADVPITDMFGLFFGAGLGIGFSDTDATSPIDFPHNLVSNDITGSADNVGFSWMGTAGITASPLKWMNVDLSYRYSDLGGISWRTGTLQSGGVFSFETDDFSAQELLLGIRVAIPNMVKKAN